MTVSGEPSIETLYPHIMAGDIVIPDENRFIHVADDYGYRQIEERLKLMENGVNYAIYGISPDPKMHQVTREFEKYQKEVDAWELANAQRINTDYLERIVTADEPDSARLYITSLTFSKVFAEMFTGMSTHGAARSAGNIHKHVADICDTSRNARSYLLNGTVMIGNPIKSGSERWHQSMWGITPPALKGITMETAQKRPFGFGRRGLHTVNKLFDYIMLQQS